MKKQQDSFALRASVMAVRGALITLVLAPVAYAADAADPAVAELTQPTNSIAIGATNASDRSAKFGEYNGLYKKGGTLDADFELRGTSKDGATQFKASGSNLGLDTRELKAEFGEQGRFRINMGYDQIHRDLSDSFQTPYLGVGSNNLTMPQTWVRPLQLNVNPNATTPVVPGLNFQALSPSWIANDTIYRFNNTANNNNVLNGASVPVVGGVTTPLTGGATGPMAAYAATAAQQAAMLATANTDLGLFRQVDLYTERSKYSGGFDMFLNNQWNLNASASREDKKGITPRSWITGSETYATLPNPIDESHNQFNLSLNFKDDARFLKVAYYGSVYQNHINGMTIEDASTRNLTTPGTVLTSATPPSNQLHQFSLTGGYNYSAATKLVGDASYSRNTQDDAFLTSLNTPALPAGVSSWLPTNSLHGVVATKSFDLKLTSKPVNDLNVTAAYKFNDRHNTTPVHTYIFADLDGATSGTSPFRNALLPDYGNVALGAALGTGGGGSVLANRAYSKKTNQVNLEADYRLSKAQAVKVGYDWQKINRYCDGSWTDCATADATKENTVRAEWRGKVDQLNGRVGLARSERRADNYNVNAWLATAPMANLVPDQTVANTGGMSLYQTMQAFGLTGWGPVAGYPAIVPLGTANPTGATLSAAQWSTLLGVPAANISANQLLALNYWYPNGNKVTTPNTRNALFMMPGQQNPIDGDRNRDKLRASLNWQATEQFSLFGGVEYNRDNYNNTVAGLKDGKSKTLNLDGTYEASSTLSSSLYYSYQEKSTTIAGPGVGTNADGSAASSGSIANTAAGSLVGASCNGYTSNAQSLQNAKVDPCLAWSTVTTDKINTLGFNLRNKGMMGGKLEMNGGLGYTKAVTSQNYPSGGNYVTTLYTVANFGAGATPWTRTWVPAASMPDVTSKVITLNIGGKYALDKASAVRFGYTYQNMKSSDWLYANRAPGTGWSGLLPSFETSPNYTVQTVSAAYIYSFR